MPKQFHSKLAGVTSKNEDGSSRQRIIKKYVDVGQVIYLTRERDNPHDGNAISAHVIDIDDKSDDGFLQIGYLNAGVAEELAPDMDRGCHVGCEVSEVTGGDQGESLGVNILLTVFTLEETQAMKAKAEAKAETKEKMQDWVEIQAAKPTPAKTSIGASPANTAITVLLMVLLLVSLCSTWMFFAAAFQDLSQPGTIAVGVVLGLICAAASGFLIKLMMKRRTARKLE